MLMAAPSRHHSQIRPCSCIEAASFRDPRLKYIVPLTNPGSSVILGAIGDSSRTGIVIRPSTTSPCGMA